MERLTQNNFDYCLEMCEPECMHECPFYKDDQDSKCHTAAMYDRLAAYEDTGLEPEEVKEITSWSYGPFHKKMGDWLKAEREDRLVVLPCKVGDTVYVLNASKFHRGEVYEGYVSSFHYSFHGLEMLGTGFYGRVDDLLNKKVFLTRAEAEKAMEVNRE